MDREQLDYETKLVEHNEALDAAKEAYNADPSDENSAALTEVMEAASAHVRAMRTQRDAAAAAVNDGDGVATPDPVATGAVTTEEN